jgi:hypothetical protein
MKRSPIKKDWLNENVQNVDGSTCLSCNYIVYESTLCHVNKYTVVLIIIKHDNIALDIGLRKITSLRPISENVHFQNGYQP